MLIVVLMLALSISSLFITHLSGVSRANAQAGYQKPLVITNANRTNLISLGITCFTTSPCDICHFDDDVIVRNVCSPLLNLSGYCCISPCPAPLNLYNPRARDFCCND